MVAGLASVTTSLVTEDDAVEVVRAGGEPVRVEAGLQDVGPSGRRECNHKYPQKNRAEARLDEATMSCGCAARVELRSCA